MVALLRTLTFFVLFWLHQILILPLLCWRLLQARQHAGPFIWERVAGLSRSWGRLCCWLGGATVTVHDHSGLPPERSVLLAANHQGDFDIPVLLGYAGRRLAFVAKKELSHIPLVSQWMSLMGCIFLDREDKRKQVRQIRQTVTQLQQGQSMVIFPEGTRSRGGPMKPFAAGSLSIAEKAGVPIVPVTLVDTYTLFPKGAKTFPGGRVSLHLHPAIFPETLSPDDKKNLHLRVQETVKSVLPKQG